MVVVSSLQPRRVHGGEGEGDPKVPLTWPGSETCPSLDSSPPVPPLQGSAPQPWSTLVNPVTNPFPGPPYPESCPHFPETPVNMLSYRPVPPSRWSPSVLRVGTWGGGPGSSPASLLWPQRRAWTQLCPAKASLGDLPVARTEPSAPHLQTHPWASGAHRLLHSLLCLSPQA